jgi:hypothetical protein
MSKLAEKLKSHKDIEVPFEVWRFFGTEAKIIAIAGNNASLGEDFGSLNELRHAVAWYVDQLGGEVTWKK